MTTIQESAPAILIVDDAPSSLAELTDLFRRNGFRVRAAINGGLALKAASNETPDLVILDILMPGMDGFEVCRRLKADAATAEVPVIFIGAHDEIVDTAKAFEVGGMDYITRPFNPEVMLARVQTLLNIRRMQIALARQNSQLQREIAARKASEEKAHESEMRCRSILEASPDPIVIYDSEGKTRYVNPAFERLYGWTSEELLDRRIDFVPEDEQEVTRKAWQQTLAGENIRLETKRLNKNGELLDIELRTVFIKNSEGRPSAGIVTLLRDVTERNQAITRLKESEEKFRNLFESAPEGIVITTVDGEILSFNKAFMQLYKISDPDAVAGRNVKRLYMNPQKDRPAVLAQLQEKGQLENVELDFKDALGNPFKASLSLRMIKYEQKSCILTILRDITAIKKMEAKLKSYTENLEQRVAERTTQLETVNRKLAQALQDVGKMARQNQAANEAKSVFLANMSHELRTPLNAILGYTQLLSMRYKDDSELIERLGTIEQSGAHLLSLINDILDLSKIEAGHLDLYPAALRFSEFLDGITNIARSRANAKGLVCRMETVGPVPGTVNADETRLRQVLLNLLGNAIKFTDHGQVCLRVISAQTTGLDRDLAPDGIQLWRLRFEVHDTGCGIPGDKLSRIFAPFEQVGDISRRAEGTGLGLTISRQLVRMMGGDLNARSPAAEGFSDASPGSTFSFEISLPAVDDAPMDQQPAARVITGYRGPRRKILVADDVESNRMLIINLLEPLGFDLIQAQDGLEAVSQARAFEPDMILMDLRMPRMDGWEAIRQIRRMPVLHRTCIIAITASASLIDPPRIKAAGIDAYLVKPIDWAGLSESLAHHLNLQWQYSGSDDTVDAGDHVEFQEDIVAPPRSELEALYDLACMGKIHQLLARVQMLSQKDAPYRGFAEKLTALTGRYKIKQIQTILRRYMDKEEG